MKTQNFSIRDVNVKTVKKFRKIAEKRDEKHRVLLENMVDAYEEKLQRLSRLVN